MNIEFRTIFVSPGLGLLADAFDMKARVSWRVVWWPRLDWSSSADNAALRRGDRTSVMLIGPSGGRASHHDLMDALGNDSMFGLGENVAHALRDHLARGVYAQLATARFERGPVPGAADFERLFRVAGFRGMEQFSSKTHH
jgi:hypothetical protein